MEIDKSMILNRIKSYLGLDKDAEFARYLGISPQTLSSWHSRNTFDIHLLYSKCVFVNAEWLLTGEGEMLKNQYVEKNIPESVVSEPQSIYDADGWKHKYDALHQKYTALLEKHTALLTNKLEEIIKDKRAI